MAGTGAFAPDIRRYLIPGERMVAEVHWHPVWLLRSTLVLLSVLAVTGWLAAGLDDGDLVGVVLGPVILAVVLWYLWRFLEWRTERLVVTDRRLLMINGLISRRLAVMPLRKVTDMTFTQPLLGRLFEKWGWGTFVFESAGQDQAFHTIPFLPRPDELYQCLTNEIFGENGIYGRKPPKVAPGQPAPDRRDDEE